MLANNNSKNDKPYKYVAESIDKQTNQEDHDCTEPLTWANWIQYGRQNRVHVLSRHTIKKEMSLEIEWVKKRKIIEKVLFFFCFLTPNVCTDCR